MFIEKVPEMRGKMPIIVTKPTQIIFLFQYFTINEEIEVVGCTEDSVYFISRQQDKYCIIYRFLFKVT